MSLSTLIILFAFVFVVLLVLGFVISARLGRDMRALWAALIGFLFVLVSESIWVWIFLGVIMSRFRDAAAELSVYLESQFPAIATLVERSGLLLIVIGGE